MTPELDRLKAEFLKLWNRYDDLKPMNQIAVAPRIRELHHRIRRLDPAWSPAT